jgi:acetyl esterase/lipase
LPIGYLFTTVLVAWGTFFAVAAPRPRRSRASSLSFWFGFFLNELPFLAFLWLLASTLLALAQGDLDTPIGCVGLGVALLATLGLVVIVRRSLRARPAVEHALNESLAADLRLRLQWARILFAPFTFRSRKVERISDLRYGDAGRRNLLDVYRRRDRPADCPTLIHFHGGAFRRGRKSREARPLFHRLASRGWVCISANYRLAGDGRFPDPLIDAKKAIAWVRAHGPEYGVDSDALFVAGSSAGGHLASMSALTPGDPRLQPGFEEADTSVTAAISLYGYYGPVGSSDPSTSPHAYLRPNAPPFFVVHGDRDTVVVVDDARRFVAALRTVSTQPVAYAELPGAHHTFDVFHSIRFESVIAGIEAFAARVHPARGVGRMAVENRGGEA